VSDIPPYLPPAQLVAAAGQYEHDPHSRELIGPSNFAVSATVTRSGRRLHGRGELVIAPDSIVFAPFASSGELAEAGEFAHTGRSITITRARLRPPWADTFLLLRDKTLLGSGVTAQLRTSWRAPRLPAGPPVACSWANE
jgi:hypothetical protein